MLERIKKMSLKELQALEKVIAEERETRIESELSGICTKLIEDIDALLDCCHKVKRHHLGTISVECEECDMPMDFDILNEGILESIRDILAGYTTEEA